MSGSSEAGNHSGDPVAWVFAESRAKGTTRLLLVALARCGDYRRCLTSPSIERLMAMTRLSRTQVFFHLRKLRNLGEIQKVGFHPGTGASVYHLTRFCEAGSDKGVRLPGMECRYVVVSMARAGGVRQTGYVRSKKNHGHCGNPDWQANGSQTTPSREGCAPAPCQRLGSASEGPAQGNAEDLEAFLAECRENFQRKANYPKPRSVVPIEAQKARLEESMQEHTGALPITEPEGVLT